MNDKELHGMIEKPFTSDKAVALLTLRKLEEIAEMLKVLMPKQEVAVQEVEEEKPKAKKTSRKKKEVVADDVQRD